MKMSKIMDVTDARDVPNGYVQLSAFKGRDYSHVRKLMDKGTIKGVRLRRGRTGFLFVDPVAAKQALESEKSVEMESQRPIDESKLYMVLHYHERLLGAIMKKLDAIWNTEESEFKLLGGDLDQNKKLFGAFVQSIGNLNRHVCIQGTLLCSIVEELGLGKEVFSKEMVRERIVKMNRLLTIEEWDEGFETDDGEK
jgi:hypothetical protein